MNFLQRALHMESHVARIIGKQELAGCAFDLIRANWYVHVLEEQTLELYRQARPSLQLVVNQPYAGPVNKPFLIKGGYNANVLKWYTEEEAQNVCGPFSRVEFNEPEISKRQQIVSQLLRLGWKPREYTPVTKKGGGNNPKLTVDDGRGGKEPCPSLLEINGTVGAALARWYILKHRQSQIKGLIRLVRPDGRISAKAHCIGTPTYRFRHSGVVNVPKAKEYVIFGKQMRSLFTVKGKTLNQVINHRGLVERVIKKEDWPKINLAERFNWAHYRMVGHDASGLELRVLAHYINDEGFTKSVSEGDPHEANRKAAGLPTRDDAKTFIYAFIYGAGNKKIGSIIGGSSKEGAAIKARFLKANPKLSALIDGVRSAASKGWVKGIDGRRVRIRRDPETNRPQIHKALNALIQTGGALVMKYSMVWLDLAVGMEKLDVTKVIDMHDEGQAEVSFDDSARYAYLAEKSIRKAGEYLEMRCPLDAEAKIDTRWSKTH